jgi:hypothetical protein
MGKTIRLQRLASLAVLAGGLAVMNLAQAGGTVRAAPPEVQAAPAPVAVAPAPMPVVAALHCGPGYVCDSARRHVRNSNGLCVRTGSWTPALAEPGCDPLPVLRP